MCNFHSMLMNRAAKLNCKLWVLEIPPTSGWNGQKMPDTQSLPAFLLHLLQGFLRSASSNFPVLLQLKLICYGIQDNLKKLFLAEVGKMDERDLKSEGSSRPFQPISANTSLCIAATVRSVVLRFERFICDPTASLPERFNAPLPTPTCVPVSYAPAFSSIRSTVGGFAGRARVLHEPKGHRDKKLITLLYAQPTARLLDNDTSHSSLGLRPHCPLQHLLAVPFLFVSSSTPHHSLCTTPLVPFAPPPVSFQCCSPPCFEL